MLLRRPYARQCKSEPSVSGGRRLNWAYAFRSLPTEKVLERTCANVGQLFLVPSLANQRSDQLDCSYCVARAEVIHEIEDPRRQLAAALEVKRRNCIEMLGKENVADLCDVFRERPRSRVRLNPS